MFYSSTIVLSFHASNALNHCLIFLKTLCYQQSQVLDNNTIFIQVTRFSLKAAINVLSKIDLLLRTFIDPKCTGWYRTITKMAQDPMVSIKSLLSEVKMLTSRRVGVNFSFTLWQCMTMGEGILCINIWLLAWKCPNESLTRLKNPKVYTEHKLCK